MLVFGSGFKRIRLESDKSQGRLMKDGENKNIWL